MHTSRGGNAYFPSSEIIVKEGCDKVTKRTVDIDVVVLAVAASQRAIGTALEPSKCRTLPFLHALSGCDMYLSSTEKARKLLGPHVKTLML